MNFDDLKNIDLKNIDVNSIVPALLAKKDLLAQAIAVMLAVVVLIALLGNYFSQSQGLKQQVDQLKEKVAAVKTYDDGVVKVKKFLTALPKALDDESLSNQITDFAAHDNMTILSYTPGQRKQDALSEVSTVTINVRAGTYKDFLSFLRAIEKAPYALRIDACSVGVSAGKALGSEGAGGAQSDFVDAQIDISSVSIKK